jgi:hypothetical protein
VAAPLPAAADPDLEVEVRSLRVACLADVAKQLPSRDVVADADEGGVA